MTKHKFLVSLKDRLSGLSKEAVEERLNFYREMIEDRMEEGLSEEDAVAETGSVDEIAAQIAADLSPATASKRRMNAWEIVFLLLGSPLWLSLLIAAFAVLLSLYASLWAVIVSLWAVFGSLAVCSMSCLAAGIIFACTGSSLTGLAATGAGCVCAGLAIFMLFGCRAATKGAALLTKSMAAWIKKRLPRKEDAQ